MVHFRHSTSTANDFRHVTASSHVILCDRRVQPFCHRLNMRDWDGTIGIVITLLKSRRRPATVGKERVMRTLALVLALVAAPITVCIHGQDARATHGRDAHAADEALHPWSTNTHPTDVAKSHVEEISAAAGGVRRYTVVQGGTMDGRNCRSPMGCGIAREGAFLQTWESNRSVRMENVGETDVVNPWLSNGRNNFRSVEEIVAAAVTPDMTRRGEGLCPLVPGDPVPPPFRGRQQRAGRPGEGLQRLRLQHLRQRLHLLGHAVAQGRPQGGARPGAGPLHLPGLLRRRLAFL